MDDATIGAPIKEDKYRTREAIAAIVERVGKVAKAGIILHGMADAPTPFGPRRQLHVLATYTEGRFGDHHKYYSAPKGEVDDGESPLLSAVREMKEETGFDLEDFLGAERYQAFLAGEVIADAVNPAYPGVKILHADPNTPIEDTYLSIRGKHHRTQYFPIEMEGIEHLRPGLKSIPGNSSYRSPTVRRTSTVMTAEAIARGELPSFEARLGTLRTGWVKLSGHPEARILAPHTAFERYEALWLEAQGRTGHIATKADWQAFLKKPPMVLDYDQPAEKPPLKNCLPLIKEDMKKIKAYYKNAGIAGDVLFRKMDIKQNPLKFYHEAAEVVPASVLLERMVACARRSPEYAEAMFGEKPKDPNLSDEAMMAQAQITPLMKFLAKCDPMGVANAAIHVGNETMEQGWAEKISPGLNKRGARLAQASLPLPTHNTGRHADRLAEPNAAHGFIYGTW